MNRDGDLLQRWANDEPITIDELGGPEALIERTDLVDAHPLRAVQTVCELWPELENYREDAAHFLVGAAENADIEFADDIHDEILNNSDVLAAVHSHLAAALQRVATQGQGITADIAAESWTRLALGGWCSSLTVCGQLQVMAAAARKIDATTSYLVRAIGAALQRWGYEELLAAMADLGSIAEYEADAAFELGLHHLGVACVSTSQEQALQSLRDAVEEFELAERWESRVDARAYLGPIRGLLRFVDGNEVSREEVMQARAVVGEYMLGYRGLQRHWRQGRADLTDGWSGLLGLLSAAAEGSTPAWFNPTSIIEGAARLLVADTTLTLIVRTPEDTATGVVALVEPRIAADFANQPPSADFIDKWLDAARAATEPDEEMIGAVSGLRQTVTRAASNPEDGGPGNSPGGSAERSLADFRNLYQTHRRQLNLTEEKIAHRVFRDIEQIVPETMQDVPEEISGVVTELVKFTSHFLSLRQSGARSPAWLVGGRDLEGHFPKEHVLSDALRTWFQPNFGNVTVEDADVAGGFADVVLRYPRCAFYVEVKREEANADNDLLVEKYGDQAAQYAVANAPVAFLAVLDYAERLTRIDLEGTMWTIPHRHDGASRDYALTGIRIQGNLSSPSASSRLPLKSKRKA
ncbi:hypothetical protein [Salinibacterium sp. ZJ454]|uniref:hypothetical protein n=1 Tax=Salinibacterium sp. ZJ454 TaxID=2708339 RepID=UPI001422103C|nr:hypothetical protein [Salinibacterium sp. ZJ454]